MNQFFNLEPQEIQASKKEVIRYLGYRALHQPDEVIDKLIDECILELQKVLRPSLVWDTYELTVQNDTCLICGNEIVSQKLAENLRGCKNVVMFASTIGSEVDKLIRTTNVINQAKACVFQATGAMFVEEFVDMFNNRIDENCFTQGHKTRKRYSPGYGDLKLDTQKLFFNLLNCSKIGLSLMDTLIMAPEKSVTAFIGIE